MCAGVDRACSLDRRQFHDLVAVDAPGEEPPVRLTYRELNNAADALATQLVASGAKVGAIVGIYLQRCADYVVALLAILKTGAAYFPIEPGTSARARARTQRARGVAARLTLGRGRRSVSVSAGAARQSAARRRAGRRRHVGGHGETVAQLSVCRVMHAVAAK